MLIEMGIFNWLARKTTNKEEIEKSVLEREIIREKERVIIDLTKAVKFLRKIFYYWSTDSGEKRYYVFSNNDLRDAKKCLDEARGKADLLIQKVRGKLKTYRSNLNSRDILLIDKYSNLIQEIDNYYLPSLRNFLKRNTNAEGDLIKRKGARYNLFKEVRTLLEKLNNLIKEIKSY